MKIFEIKDRVRAHIGTYDLPNWQLDQYVDGGRREVEKLVNGHWMRKRKNFVTVASQQTHGITAAGVSDLNLPNFKDARILFVKPTDGTRWAEVDLDMDFEEAEQLYETDEKGEPEVGVIDDETLYFFPIPDKVYDCRLFHYEFTSNPTQTGTEDALIKRFPEALIYASDMFGAREFLKDFAKAAAWEEQLRGEINKIDLYNKARAWPTRVMLRPKGGALSRTHRRRQVTVWV